MQIFGIDIRIYFLIFIIYAVAGWTIEVIGKLIECKRFINRGFLIGSYCPIYGYGALLITLLLNKYTNDPIVLFVMAMLICGILEYLTSYFMEKVFKARWWDYSKKKYNINGRVCLDTIIPFGILGLFIMYISNPFLLSKLELLPELWLNILFWTLLILYIADNIVSGIVIGYVKKTEKTFETKTDNTEEITKKVKQVLQNKSILHRRLLNAYPNLEAVKTKIKEKKEKIKEQVEEQKREIEKKVEKGSKKVEEKIKNIKEDKKIRNNKNNKENNE